MYQIHKGGNPIDNSNGGSLGATCAKCIQLGDGRYVVEVDIFDKVVRRLTPEECQKMGQVHTSARPLLVAIYLYLRANPDSN